MVVDVMGELRAAMDVLSEEQWAGLHKALLQLIDERTTDAERREIRARTYSTPSR